MQQYFAKNKNLELEDSDYHHIKNVMRMKKDDIIKVVFDNVVYTCKLTSITNKSSFEIINKEEKDKKDYSVDVAFFIPNTFLANSITAICIPKQIPR